MTALIILGILALILTGICLIRVGADIDFTGGSLKVAATVCGAQLQLYPRPPKPEGKAKPDKPKKEKKPKQKPPEQAEDGEKPKKKKGIPLGLNRDEILGLLKAVLCGLGRFRKFRVDRFLLHVTVGGKDPYNTALEFGYLNAALSALEPVCKANLNIRDSDVWTDVDFTAEKIVLDAAAGFSIRIGQIFGVINTILFGALGIVLRNRFRILRETIRKKLHPEPMTEENSGTPPEPETKETTVQLSVNLNKERNEDNGKE